MIGRHAECQIRPKSRSVSRRHCVVYHGEERLKVLDLDSTSGTKINHVRIEPRVWSELEDGDELSCGKIRFLVSCKKLDSSSQTSPSESRPEQIVPNSVTQESSLPIAHANGEIEPSKDNKSVRIASEVPDADNPGNGKMVTGKAWETFDVANFLESQDDEDRERRYDKIREDHRNSEGESVTVDSVRDEPVDTETDFLEDDFSAMTDEDDPESSSDQLPDDAAASDAKSKPAESTRKASGRNTELRSNVRPMKRMPRQGPPIGQKFASMFSGDTDRIKLFMMFALAVVIIVFVVMQLIDIVDGPPVRVIDDLD